IQLKTSTAGIGNPEITDNSRHLVVNGKVLMVILERYKPGPRRPPAPRARDSRPRSSSHPTSPLKPHRVLHGGEMGLQLLKVLSHLKAGLRNLALACERCDL
ncbi:hypothetical protein EVAR_67859_1, partial [Eumeta japonica]